MNPLDELEGLDKPLIIRFQIDRNCDPLAPELRAFKGLPLKLKGLCGDGDPVKAFHAVYGHFVYEMNYGVQIDTVNKGDKEIYVLLSKKQNPQEVLDQARGEFANKSIAEAIEEGNYFLVDPCNGAIFSDDWFMLHVIFSGATKP